MAIRAAEPDQRVFEGRLGLVAYQGWMLNFAVLAFALLSAAYVSALSDKLYGVAGAVALLAGAVAVTANLAARRQRKIGWIAAEPIREIQRRLAADLRIDSLRILDRYPASQPAMAIRQVGGNNTAPL